MPLLEVVPSNYRHIKLKYGPYSASRLLVASCPSRFYSKYVLKDVAYDDSSAAARGSVIHETLQKITEAHVQNRKITPLELNSWIEQALGKYPAAYSQLNLIKGAATKYAGNPSPYITPNTICEQEIAVALFEEESFDGDAVPNFQYMRMPYTVPGTRHQLNPDAFFGAKLDQITVDDATKIVTVLDHKSTPSASHNSDHDFQLGAYAWIASLLYPGYHVRTVIHYAHPELNFYKSPVYWSYEDLQEVEQEIRMRVRAVESFTDYPAVPGSHCDYCHMVQLCPVNVRLREQFARGDINLNAQTQSDRQRIAKELRTIGVLYDQLNKVLRTSIENNCPENGVAIDGMWYGFSVSEEKVDWYATDRKIQELHEAGECAFENLAGVLENHELTPDAFKEWNSSKLKALWKTNKEALIEDLRELVVTERTTRFGGKKI
jgi:hypothetical protein